MQLLQDFKKKHKGILHIDGKQTSKNDPFPCFGSIIHHDGEIEEDVHNIKPQYRILEAEKVPLEYSMIMDCP